MTDLPTAIRAASDALLRELEVLETLEEEKRLLDLDDPRISELSERIEGIAYRILAASAHQRALSENAEGPPIETHPRPVGAILAEWRDAERQRAAAAPGSAQAMEAEARAQRAREEYRRAFEAARTRGPGLDDVAGA